VVVAGALAAEVGVGDRVAWLDAVALAEELAPGLVVALPEAEPLDELVDELVDVGAELVAAGEDEDEDGEHPATATVRMAKTPKPVTVCFALSAVPAMVPRTVM
jgi:hypothetical protein